MKKEIHPRTYMAKFRCACGNEFEAISTMETVSLDICSACHPFYTGKQKMIDLAGRVDRFNKRYANVKK